MIYFVSLLFAASVPSTEPAIEVDDLVAHVKVLSSDEFGGRAPFSRGEELTVAYLTEAYERFGLEPVQGQESYIQEVPLVSITSTNPQPLNIQFGSEERAFAYGEDAMTGTMRVQESVTLEDSPIVFVGYGIVAPEYDWNDYEGLDVEGKTVVMLVNDPGYATKNDALFTGNKMTYYGRWTYKYEEAARQGAAAAIVIHEDGAAGYPWEVVRNSWSGPQFHLDDPDGHADRVKVEAWVTQGAARELFTKSGQDFDALAAAAAEPGFRSVPLEATASTTVTNALQHSVSQNVIGVIPGSIKPQETVVYMAHWDHLGRGFGAGTDTVYNGAVDNASGVAGMLEIAERFAANEEAPARTIAFLAVAAEESGLLGSRHFAENPTFSLEKTVAGINMDSMHIYGPTEDMVVVGYGSSELEDMLARYAAAHGRYLLPEPTPEKGYYFRSDHFNFAKKGVPMLYADAGTHHVDEDAAYIPKLMEDYIANRYHKPADEYADTWDLRGAAQDLRAFYAMGVELSQPGAWPEWYEGNAFRAARKASAAERASSAR